MRKNFRIFSFIFFVFNTFTYYKYFTYYELYELFSVQFPLISFLVFGIRPKIIILNSTKNNNLVRLKRGKLVTKCSTETPFTPGFLWAKKNLPPGWYTYRYGGGSLAYSRADSDRSEVNMEGAQTAIGDGVGPPLSVDCDQSWPSLGPPLLNLYVYSRGTKCQVYGSNVWWEEHFIPIPTFFEKHNCLQSRSTR